ncbi:carboxypeptidase-like protein [Dysgonomonas alginatilytica]|uniref:Carboxypeptidase-like protein n=1 Tax=Dysgonomonas alginatilytica TaxID=1605892 RepID=A0A2V3PVT6_9BACT|nr:carboxypeptidase-like regulatory domain-containing protein [Dysgonomonas alginatilytica]PXV69242.1 carboxypeptidase-like protein [Dysgonomonas alginatilytica]
MKTIYTSLILLLYIGSYMNLSGQENVIRGLICEENNAPLAFANISIAGTIDGTSSEEDGTFVLETSAMGLVVLKVTSLGCEDYTRELNIPQQDKLIIILKPNAKVLSEVVVSASSFQLKGGSQADVKNAVELVTVAGSDGDLYKAMSVLPGVQAAGSDGKLLVRGGESRESQTYIDDMHVLNPYSSTPENTAARSRYSPFLFDGISFQLGGYSSEYSQGLSSVLPLSTKDESRFSKLGVSLLNVGAGAGGTKSWARASASFNMDYTNLGPYENLLYPTSRGGWIKPYSTLSAQNQLRFNIGENSILKTYFAYDKTRFERVTRNDFSTSERNLNFKEDNTYLNTTFRTKSKSGFNFFSGAALSVNDKKIADGLVVNDRVGMKESELHLKAKMSKRFSDMYKLGIGAESMIRSYEFSYADTATYGSDIDHSINGVYVMNDFILTSNLFLNVSSRLEYTSINKSWNVLPRISLTYNYNDYTVLATYGKYQQLADRDYLLYNNELNTEICEHLLFGVHHQSKNKVYRAEFYHKTYDNLVTGSNYNYGTSGEGFSNGVDLFFSDTQFLKNWQYTLAYSYNNSKRSYLKYSEKVTPEYVTQHNASITLKYDLLKYKTIWAVTNRFASGRPYHNPNKPGVMNSETSPYNSLDFCVTYLAHKKVIVYASASNVLNRSNVFGYNYSSQKNDSGKFDRVAVQSDRNQFFVVGLFITLGGKTAYDPSTF